MTKEYRKTLCDIDLILNNIDDNERNKVPISLREFIHNNKLENYESTINKNIPIDEQELSKETTAFIAMLYLNYWCENESEKEELKNKIHENEIIYQEELRKKYNVNNIFKTEEKDNTENKNIETALIEDDEMIIKKIWNFIKSILKFKK